MDFEVAEVLTYGDVISNVTGQKWYPSWGIVDHNFVTVGVYWSACWSAGYHSLPSFWLSSIEAITQRYVKGPVSSDSDHHWVGKSKWVQFDSACWRTSHEQAIYYLARLKLRLQKPRSKGKCWLLTRRGECQAPPSKGGATSGLEVLLTPTRKVALAVFDFQSSNLQFEIPTTTIMADEQETYVSAILSFHTPVPCETASYSICSGSLLDQLPGLCRTPASRNISNTTTTRLEARDQLLTETGRCDRYRSRNHLQL